MRKEDRVQRDYVVVALAFGSVISIRFVTHEAARAAAEWLQTKSPAMKGYVTIVED